MPTFILLAIRGAVGNWDQEGVAIESPVIIISKKNPFPDLNFNEHFFIFLIFNP
jgi:hypothetical protein